MNYSNFEVLEANLKIFLKNSPHAKQNSVTGQIQPVSNQLATLESALCEVPVGHESDHGPQAQWAAGSQVFRGEGLGRARGFSGPDLRA